MSINMFHDIRACFAVAILSHTMCQMCNATTLVGVCLVEGPRCALLRSCHTSCWVPTPGKTIAEDPTQAPPPPSAWPPSASSGERLPPPVSASARRACLPCSSAGERLLLLPASAALLSVQALRLLLVVARVLQRPNHRVPLWWCRRHVVAGARYWWRWPRTCGARKLFCCCFCS
jgi:hypothetical protein